MFRPVSKGDKACPSHGVSSLHVLLPAARAAVHQLVAQPAAGGSPPVAHFRSAARAAKDPPTAPSFLPLGPFAGPYRKSIVGVAPVREGDDLRWEEGNEGVELNWG